MEDDKVEDDNVEEKNDDIEENRRMRMIMIIMMRIIIIWGNALLGGCWEAKEPAGSRRVKVADGC